ncbi:hypothetical protein [Chryseobacterium gossypii]|uniref:hypothetical protein n=1 Tax=Chryseobacterium gossypii TaxID=3231602 RepID=UPI003525FF31
MLSGELEYHSGYTKNGKKSSNNARNEITTKWLKTELGESIIEAPEIVKEVLAYYTR